MNWNCILEIIVFVKEHVAPFVTLFITIVVLIYTIKGFKFSKLAHINQSTPNLTCKEYENLGFGHDRLQLYKIYIENIAGKAIHVETKSADPSYKFLPPIKEINQGEVLALELHIEEEEVRSGFIDFYYKTERGKNYTQQFSFNLRYKQFRFSIPRRG